MITNNLYKFCVFFLFTGENLQYFCTLEEQILVHNSAIQIQYLCKFPQNICVLNFYKHLSQNRNVLALWELVGKKVPLILYIDPIGVKEECKLYLLLYNLSSWYLRSKVFLLRHSLYFVGCKCCFTRAPCRAIFQLTGSTKGEILFTSPREQFSAICK